MTRAWIMKMTRWFLFQNNYIQKCNIWPTKHRSLVSKQLLMKSYSQNSRKSYQAWVQIKLLIASVHNTNVFIEPSGILMSKRKNYWEDAEISQRILLLVLLSYNQLWSFLTTTHIQYHIWKHKWQRLTSIWSFLESMKNCQNTKYKGLKPKWKNYTC